MNENEPYNWKLPIEGKIFQDIPDIDPPGTGKSSFKIILNRDWFNKGDVLKEIFINSKGKIITNRYKILFVKLLMFLKLKKKNHYLYTSKFINETVYII